MESGKLSLFLKVEETETSRVLHPCYYKYLSKNELQLISPPNIRQTFQFQKIFSADDNLVENLSMPLSNQVLQGSNACLIVTGYPDTSPKPCLFSAEGMVASSVKFLHKQLSQQKDHFVIMLSFFEVIEGKLNDLAEDEKHEIEIEDSQGKSYMKDLTLVEYKTPADVDSLLQRGIAHIPPSSSSDLVFAINISRKSKTTTNTKFYFVDLNNHSAAMKTLMNALQAQFRGNQVTLPFRSSKLTHAMQPVFSGFTSVEILSLVSAEPTSHYDAWSVLGYSSSLLETEECHVSSVAELSKINELNQLELRLKEEIEELHRFTWKSQYNHENNLKNLGKLVGIEGSIELLPQVQRGSQLYDFAKKFREASQASKIVEEHKKALRKRYGMIDHVLMEHNIISNTNRCKHMNEIVMIEDEIRTAHKDMEGIEEMVSQKTSQMTAVTTDKLEKLLMNAHLKLEEEATPIHLYPDQFNAHQSVVSKQRKEWEVGVHTARTEYIREIQKYESDLKQILENLNKQYTYKIELKDEQLRKSLYEINKKMNTYKDEAREIKKEMRKFSELRNEYADFIRFIASGKILSQCTQIKELMQKRSSVGNSLRSTLTSTGQIEELRMRCTRINKEDSVPNLLGDKKTCYELQTQIKDFYHQIAEYTSKKHVTNLEQAKSTLETLKTERDLVKLEYTKIIGNKLLTQPFKLPSVRSDIKAKVFNSYTKLQNFRIPILPRKKVNFEKRLGLKTVTSDLLPHLTSNAFNKGRTCY